MAEYRDANDTRQTSDRGTVQLRYETIAALAAEMFAGSRPLVNNIRDKFEGHLPMLQRLIDVANEFEDESVLRAVVWDETHDWILCVEMLANQVHDDEGIVWDEVFAAGKVKVPHAD